MLGKSERGSCFTFSSSHGVGINNQLAFAISTRLLHGSGTELSDHGTARCGNALFELSNLVRFLAFEQGAVKFSTIKDVLFP